VKHTLNLDRANEKASTIPVIADGALFNEIVALLAEMLVLDYQEHKRITVSSPPRID